MENNYMLCDKLAMSLYNNTARDLPIIDYHNHLNVSDIAKNGCFENITSLWISTDPYKHRAMRILGVEEKYITGDADDFAKFEKWYGCLPLLAGNVLFHWSQMELDSFFGIDLVEQIEKETPAKALWNRLNDKVAELTPKAVLESFNIEYLSPCAAFCDDLAVFCGLDKIHPSLRGDDGTNVSLGTVKKLSEITGVGISSLDEYISALEKRILNFKEYGCKFADHAVDDGFEYYPDDGKDGERFGKILSEQPLTDEEKQRLYCHILVKLCCLYEKHGITVQLHIGALRKTSTRLRNIAGPAGGYAAIGSSVKAAAITSLLDEIEKTAGTLPKTLLFNLNPCDNALMDILCGSYSKDGVKSVVSRGPAWWWCDHLKGIREMLDSFGVYSVLSTFAGMTTDSRSLLSMVRHDYFRRVVCSLISEKVKCGDLPDSEKILVPIVEKICYYNAKELI